MSSLVDFPTELLLEIIYHLHLEESAIVNYRLALVCRSLYDALLPELLGFQFDQLQAAEANSDFRITGYEMKQSRQTGSLSTASPGSHHVVFPMHSLFRPHAAQIFGGTIVSMFYRINSFSINEIWSLHSLVVRAKQVHAIHLEFDVGYGAMNRAPTVEWTRAFLKTLHACASKERIDITFAGSFSLDSGRAPYTHEIHHIPETLQAKKSNAIEPNPDSSVDSTSSDSLLGQLLSFLRSLSISGTKSTQHNDPGGLPLQSIPDDTTEVELSDETFSRNWLAHIQSIPKPLRFPSVSPWVPTISRVSKLTFLSDAVFGPTWFPYILNLISQSSFTLTHLHVTCTKLQYYDWHAIIPQWRFPQLVSVVFSGEQIAFPDLLAFLRRHPTLTSVEISKHTAIGRVRFTEEVAEALLPQLKELVATPEYLIPLLRHRSIFPMLKKLGITQEYEMHGTTVPMDDITTILRLVSARAVSSAPVTDLAIHLVRGGVGVTDWMKSAISGQGEVAEAIQALTEVTSFEASVGGPSYRTLEVEPSLLLNFVATFPSLRKAVLRDILDSSAVPSDLSDLVDEVWKSTKDLERIEIPNYPDGQRVWPRTTAYGK